MATEAEAEVLQKVEEKGAAIPTEGDEDVSWGVHLTYQNGTIHPAFWRRVQQNPGGM